MESWSSGERLHQIELGLREQLLQAELYAFLVHYDPKYWLPGYGKRLKHGEYGPSLWLRRSVKAATGLLASLGKAQMPPEEVATFINGYYIGEVEKYLAESHQDGHNPELPYLPFTADTVARADEYYQQHGEVLPILITHD